MQFGIDDTQHFWSKVFGIDDLLSHLSCVGG